MADGTSFVRPTRLAWCVPVPAAGVYRRPECCSHARGAELKGTSVLNLILGLLLIALLAGALGLGGVAGAAVSIAPILFVVVLVMLVLSLFSTTRRSRI